MDAANRHLIAIDLDDTVLAKLFSLNVDSVWALKDAQDAGHVVMIATARPECLALPYYRALGLKSLLSLMNGSYMYHPDNKSAPVFEHVISCDDVDAAVNLMQANGFKHLFLEDNNDVYTIDGKRPEHPYWRILFEGSNVHQVTDLKGHKCARIFGKAESEATARLVKEQLDATGRLRVNVGQGLDGMWNMHIWSVTADKWYTVQEAAEYYGINPENILCFGDEGNDRMMTTCAPHGFVMCNGNKAMIEDARTNGRGVTTLPCDEGGVGYEVRRLLNL